MLVISGTTAVGKTDLSILLARRLRGEIISADSAQVHCIHTLLQLVPPVTSVGYVTLYRRNSCIHNILYTSSMD